MPRCWAATKDSAWGNVIIRGMLLPPISPFPFVCSLASTHSCTTAAHVVVVCCRVRPGGTPAGRGGQGGGVHACEQLRSQLAAGHWRRRRASLGVRVERCPATAAFAAAATTLCPLSSADTDGREQMSSLPPLGPAPSSPPTTIPATPPALLFSTRPPSKACSRLRFSAQQYVY